MTETRTRWCPWHDGMVPDEQAAVVGVSEPGNPTVPCYACTTCMKVYGILPLADHPAGSTGAPIAVDRRFIGRRTGGPIAPGMSA